MTLGFETVEEKRRVPLLATTVAARCWSDALLCDPTFFSATRSAASSGTRVERKKEEPRAAPGALSFFPCSCVEAQLTVTSQFRV
jgi:hypothetical protein